MIWVCVYRVSVKIHSPLKVFWDEIWVFFVGEEGNDVVGVYRE